MKFLSPFRNSIVGAGLGSARVCRTLALAFHPAPTPNTPALAASATPKIHPRTVGGPAMQAPTSEREAPHKNTPNRSYYIVGASIARPPLPHPQPLNTPPHRWRACNAGPYKQKASPRKNTPNLSYYIVGASIARPLKPCAAARPPGWSRALPLP